MLRIQSFGILCAVTVLVIIAAIAAHEDPGAIPGEGEPLFPDLLSSINEVQKIRASSAGKSFTLEQSGGRWIAPERFGYPANGDKVHSLLVGAAGLKRIEPKTAKPELYSKLGLDEGSGDSSSAISYVLEDANGRTLAAWVTGTAAPSKGDPDASEIYVRLPDDPQAWLVEGKLPRDRSLTDWLDQTVVDIDRNRVRRVHVRHQDGTDVLVFKDTFAETDFALSDMPDDMSVNGQWRINDIGRAFTNLELSDVQPRNALPATATPSLLVTMHTFDGLEIRLDLYEIDGKAVCTLSAAYDEGLRSEGEARKSAEDVRKEATTLNEKFGRWLYTLPDFKADHLAQKRDTLLKEKDAAGQASSG